MLCPPSLIPGYPFSFFIICIYITQKGVLFSIFFQNDYETVQVEAIKGKILLMNISQSQNLFGYSLNNSRGQKTGIKWTDCVYQDGLGKWPLYVALLGWTSTRGIDYLRIYENNI